MSTVALSGDDTIMIDNRVLTDLADGTVGELKFPNGIANVKTGKNGNSIFALNQTGNNAELVLRLIRGSADDKFLLGKLSQQQANFSGTVLALAEFIKKIGDGQGNIANDTYIASGGIYEKIPEAKSNVEGEVDQSVVMYTFKFAKAVRVIT